MKNCLVINTDDSVNVISTEDHDLIRTIRDIISVKAGTIDIDVPCINSNYRLIINDDYFESDEMIKNNIATKLSKNSSIFGKAVLVKVINDFNSGTEEDIICLSDDEISKIKLF